MNVNWSKIFKKQMIAVKFHRLFGNLDSNSDFDDI